MLYKKTLQAVTMQRVQVFHLWILIGGGWGPSCKEFGPSAILLIAKEHREEEGSEEELETIWGGKLSLQGESLVYGTGSVLADGWLGAACFLHWAGLLRMEEAGKGQKWREGVHATVSRIIALYIRLHYISSSYYTCFHTYYNYT